MKILRPEKKPKTRGDILREMDDDNEEGEHT